MKKNLLSLGATFLLAAGANAQVSYGVKAGLNLPKVKITADDVNMSYTSDASTNFYVSGYASIWAAPNFAIQPGVSLQGKGGKVKEGHFTGGAAGETATLNFMSIEIPVNAVYYIPTGTVGSVFVGAGPYLGFNVSAKAKNGNISQDINIGSSDDEMKRIDYGANFLAGYKLSNGILFNLGYGLGLANLENIDSPKVKNQVLSLGVGFEF